MARALPEFWNVSLSSCCLCKDLVGARHLHAVCSVRAVVLSDCCAGTRRAMGGSWAGRIMWPSRDRALLTARGWWAATPQRVVGKDSRIRRGFDSFATGFRRVCGMVVSVSRLGVWKGGAMPAEAPRECVKEVMLRRVRERGRGDRVKGKAASAPAGWCAGTPTMVTLAP